MRVLIACEESQAVTKAFRELGHEAFSCDILPCSGGHPEWHYQQSVFEVIDKDWDLMIAHPPCTYLAVSGASWMYNKDGSRNEERYRNQMEGLEFVHQLMDADIPRIAIENPISVISSYIREPNQIIQPYFFGDKFRKTTCLWLKNLPHLELTNMVEPEIVTYGSKTYSGAAGKWFKSAEERRTERSKTFPGIAQAMAQQWGNEERLKKVGQQKSIFDEIQDATL